MLETVANGYYYYIRYSPQPTMDIDNTRSEISFEHLYVLCWFAITDESSKPCTSLLSWECLYTVKVPMEKSESQVWSIWTSLGIVSLKWDNDSFKTHGVNSSVNIISKANLSYFLRKHIQRGPRVMGGKPEEFFSQHITYFIHILVGNRRTK